MIRRLLLILSAAALPALASAAETSNGWTAIVWPNAALLAQQHTRDGYLDLTQSISCIPGEAEVTWRSYAPLGQPRPQGSRKGCDTQCRTEIVVTGSDGRRPAGFTERRLAWSEVSPAVKAETPKAVTDFVRACRLQSPSQGFSSPLQRDASAARTWADPKVVWRQISSQTSRTILPFDFDIPGKAWAYGVTSSPLATRQPAIVRLDVEGLSGRAGIALMKPDGSALVSGEQVIAAGQSAVIHLRLRPGSPAQVLLRNYDDDGVAGALRVRGIAVVSEAALTPQERAAVEPDVK